MTASQMRFFSVSPSDQMQRPTSLHQRLLNRERWGISQMTTLRWSLEEDLRYYRRAGISQIGLFRPKVSEPGEEEAAQLIKDSGIRVSSLSWGGGFTCSSGFAYHEAIDDTLDALRTAQAVGSPLLVLITGGQGAFTPKHLRGLIKETLNRLGDRAAMMGIKLALQPMHPTYCRKTSLLTNIESSLDLLDHINHPAVGLDLDLFALGFDERFSELLPTLARHTSLVTLSDAPASPTGEYDRVLLGEGSLPLISTIQRLEESGYLGVYEFQSLSETTWGMEYHELLRQSIAFFDQGVELVASGDVHSQPQDSGNSSV